MNTRFERRASGARARPESPVRKSPLPIRGRPSVASLTCERRRKLPPRDTPRPSRLAPRCRRLASRCAPGSVPCWSAFHWVVPQVVEAAAAAATRGGVAARRAEPRARPAALPGRQVAQLGRRAVQLGRRAARAVRAEPPGLAAVLRSTRAPTPARGSPGCHSSRSMSASAASRRRTAAPRSVTGVSGHGCDDVHLGALRLRRVGDVHVRRKHDHRPDANARHADRDGGPRHLALHLGRRRLRLQQLPALTFADKLWSAPIASRYWDGTPMSMRSERSRVASPDICSRSRPHHGGAIARRLTMTSRGETMPRW